MFVELLDADERSAVFVSFFVATTKALIELFDKSDSEARTLVEELRRQFSDAPLAEQNLLLHADPVALASELAEVPWDDLDPVRLEAFNRGRRQSLPQLP